MQSHKELKPNAIKIGEPEHSHNSKKLEGQ